MDFKAMKTFVTISQLKSFSKASQKLGYTQAAVTIQIKNLEKKKAERHKELERKRRRRRKKTMRRNSKNRQLSKRRRIKGRHERSK